MVKSFEDYFNPNTLTYYKVPVNYEYSGKGEYYLINKQMLDDSKEFAQNHWENYRKNRHLSRPDEYYNHIGPAIHSFQKCNYLLHCRYKSNYKYKVGDYIAYMHWFDNTNQLNEVEKKELTEKDKRFCKFSLQYSSARIDSIVWDPSPTYYGEPVYIISHGVGIKHRNVIGKDLWKNGSNETGYRRRPIYRWDD